MKIGIIGGTGLEQAILAEHEGTETDVDTPFGPPSSRPIETRRHGQDIAILNRHGEGHSIPPGEINYRANIYALKALGCTHVIASGAVGSLREEIEPKHLVIPDQVIDRTLRRTPTFFRNCAVHVDFSSPFCPVLCRHLLNAGADIGTRVHDGGTYICMEGPAFSTRAESEMHRLMGGDLIGMTVMPEAKLAREAELAYAVVAMPTDYDCWRPPKDQASPGELISEIIGNLREATASAVRLVDRALESANEISEIASPAHTALEQAILTDKAYLDRKDISSRLGIILDKYV